jgi:hypothetical protein
MRILIDHGCEPGNDYSDMDAQTWYDEAGLTDEEHEHGLAFARDKEWIKRTARGLPGNAGRI